MIRLSRKDYFDALCIQYRAALRHLKLLGKPTCRGPLPEGPEEFVLIVIAKLVSVTEVEKNWK